LFDSNNNSFIAIVDNQCPHVTHFKDDNKATYATGTYSTPVTTMIYVPPEATHDSQN